MSKLLSYLRSSSAPIAGGAFLAYCLSLPHIGHAVSTEDSWDELVDEPSRSQLFKSFLTGGSKLSIDDFGTAFPAGFRFPENVLSDGNGKSRKNSIFGLDISHYEGRGFPFAQLRQMNVSFVYLKATQGTHFADKTFGPNWLALASLPAEKAVPRGAYHFLSADPKQSGLEQANRFIAYIKLHGGLRSNDLPPALDLEWDRACGECDDRWTAGNRTASDIIKAATDFAKRVKELTGRIPLLYTNKSFLSDHGILSEEQIGLLTADCKVWIFDLSESDRILEIPNAKKNLHHILWQFTWNGKLSSGYQGNLDVDVFQGTFNEFERTLLK